jgi:hypothetical protein
MAELKLHLVAERVAERAVAMLLEACVVAKRRWREEKTFDETDAVTAKQLCANLLLVDKATSFAVTSAREYSRCCESNKPMSILRVWGSPAWRSLGTPIEVTLELFNSVTDERYGQVVLFKNDSSMYGPTRVEIELGALLLGYSWRGWEPSPNDFHFTMLFSHRQRGPGRRGECVLSESLGKALREMPWTVSAILRLRDAHNLTELAVELSVDTPGDGYLSLCTAEESPIRLVLVIKNEEEVSGHGFGAYLLNRKDAGRAFDTSVLLEQTLWKPLFIGDAENAMPSLELLRSRFEY